MIYAIQIGEKKAEINCSDDMSIEELEVVKDTLEKLVDTTIVKMADRPTGEWIPVSERLPSDGGNYLITVADLRLGHIGEHTVTMADFYAKEKKWNSIVDVYAWMPLPEPWNGGEEE